MKPLLKKQLKKEGPSRIEEQKTKKYDLVTFLWAEAEPVAIKQAWQGKDRPDVTPWSIVLPVPPT